MAAGSVEEEVMLAVAVMVVAAMVEGGTEVEATEPVVRAAAWAAAARAMVAEAMGRVVAVTAKEVAATAKEEALCMWC